MQTAEASPSSRLPSWRSGKGEAERRRRSTRLEQWEPLLTIPGYHFVNLQYGESQVDVLDVSSQLGVTIDHWPEVDSIVDLDAFTAIVSALDRDSGFWPVV